MADRAPGKSSFAMAAVALAILAVVAPMAVAAAAPCDTATNAVDKARIAAAEARWASHWRKSATGWSTAYSIRPEPKNPLGISPLRTRPDEPAPDPPNAEPIGGLATVKAVHCSYYEANPAGALIVRFVGHGLRFNENGAGLSRPIATALLEAYAVTQPAGPTASFDVMPLPEARTALAPDMVLSAPPAVVAPASAAAKRR